MKRIVLLFILLSTSQVFSQYGRRNRNYQQRRPQVETKPVKFSSEQEAGAILYDLEEVFKKVKIKPKSDEGQLLNKYVHAYNDSIETIQVMYKTTFREIDIVIENKRTELKNTRNPAVMKSVQKYLKLNLDPLKDMVAKIDENLNTALKEGLKEKTHQKWRKYQQKYKMKQAQKRKR